MARRRKPAAKPRRDKPPKPAAAPRIKALPITAIVVAAAAIAYGGYRYFSPGSSETIVVSMPRLTGATATGYRLYAENCAACHGENGGGTDTGPPFVHRIYEPGHHADAAFLLAAQRGVRAHHWRFGDMPAQPQVAPEDIDKIVAFVRAVQRENGIF